MGFAPLRYRGASRPSRPPTRPASRPHLPDCLFGGASKSRAGRYLRKPSSLFVLLTSTLSDMLSPRRLGSMRASCPASRLTTLRHRFRAVRWGRLRLMGHRRVCGGCRKGFGIMARPHPAVGQRPASSGLLTARPSMRRKGARSNVATTPTPRSSIQAAFHASLKSMRASTYQAQA